MKVTMLLPNKFKKLGWLILIPATIAGLILSVNDYEISWLNVKVFAMLNSSFSESSSFSFIDDNITNELVGLLFIVGAVLVAFTKEKKEDEFIASLRLSSLLWAVFVNYALLFMAFLFVYGVSFYSVMVYNMFTVLIIFIVRYNYVLYKNSKILSDEK